MLNSEDKPIGGFFELELPPEAGHFHQGIRLNSGRSCLCLLLQKSNIKKLYLPYYICNSVIELLLQINIDYELYQIDANFEIAQLTKLGEYEKLLYVNYFGLKTAYISKLKKIYSNALILDNTQSFFELPEKNSNAFYSPRKFFGVPDGGYLYSSDAIELATAKNSVLNNCVHLIGRIENGPEKSFINYQKHEELLSKIPPTGMSNFSDRILASLNYKLIKQKREQNFLRLHESLSTYNNLNIDTSAINGPMCYPFLFESEELRQHLLANKIFVPQYWRDVFDKGLDSNSHEVYFTKYLIPLPVDQRYSLVDMERIIACIAQL